MIIVYVVIMTILGWLALMLASLSSANLSDSRNMKDKRAIVLFKALVIWQLIISLAVGAFFCFLLICNEIILLLASLRGWV